MATPVRQGEDKSDKIAGTGEGSETTDASTILISPSRHSAPPERAHKEKSRKNVPTFKSEEFHFDSEHDCLGGGRFGTVYRSIWKEKQGYRSVALKKLHLEARLTKDNKKALAKEAYIMYSMKNCQFIVKLYGLFHREPSYYLVMELVDNGDLEIWLVKYCQAHIKWPLRWRMICEITEGMRYLHSGQHGCYCVLHHDLKPANILVTNHFHVKISDFGLSKVRAMSSRSTQVFGVCISGPNHRSGTIDYLAPEYLSRAGTPGFQYNEGCDMYSYAVVLWQFCTRRQPWPTSITDGLLESKVKSGMRPSSFENLDRENCPVADLEYIIDRCWHQEPRKRPTFDGLLQDKLPDEEIRGVSTLWTKQRKILDDLLKSGDAYPTRPSASTESDTDRSLSSYGFGSTNENVSSITNQSSSIGGEVPSSANQSSDATSQRHPGRETGPTDNQIAVGSVAMNPAQTNGSSMQSVSVLYQRTPVTGPQAVRSENHPRESMYELTRQRGMAYRMESMPRGYVVIINNVKFEKRTGMTDRNGSDMDARSLVQLFQALHFDVRVFRNLSVQVILETLVSVARDERLKDHDCFVLVVLSHGDTGVLYGTDGIIEIDKVTEIFVGNNCRHLVGKPKVVLLQACRGSQLDHGVAISDDTTDNRRSSYGDGRYEVADGPIYQTADQELMAAFPAQQQHRPCLQRMTSQDQEVQMDGDVGLAGPVKAESRDMAVQTQPQVPVMEFRLSGEMLGSDVPASPSMMNKGTQVSLELLGRQDKGTQVSDQDVEFMLRTSSESFEETGARPKCYMEFSSDEQKDVTDAGAMQAVETGARGAEKMPDRSDYLVAHSTVQGFFSWRNSKNGSWFIQTFCHTVAEFADTEDLMSIFNIVNQRLATNFESNAAAEMMCGKKQIGETASTLRYKLFFNVEKEQIRFLAK